MSANGNGQPLLAGVEEVADMLGVSPELVEDLPTNERLARSETPFPAPVAVLAQGPIFYRPSIAAWARERAATWRQTPPGRSP